MNLADLSMFLVSAKFFNYVGGLLGMGMLYVCLGPFVLVPLFFPG